MLVIRLRRAGKKKKPFYHIVVTEHTAPVQGKFVEKLGYFDPTKKSEKDQLLVKKDRIEYWMKNGAKPSDTVNNLLVKAEVLPKKELKKMSSTKKKKEKEEKPEKPAEIQTASAPEESESGLETAAEEAGEKAPEEKTEESNEEKTEEKPAEEKPQPKADQPMAEAEESKNESKSEEKPAE